MADYTKYKRLELPKSNEKYDVAVANKNNQVIDSELNKLDSKNKNQDTTIDELIVHKNNNSNPHSVTKEQVGLSNVDNTSDAEKPVSNAQQEFVNSSIIAHEESETSHGDIRQKLEEVFQSVSDGKSNLASAITDKGVNTDATDSFEQMVKNINDIKCINKTVYYPFNCSYDSGDMQMSENGVYNPSLFYKIFLLQPSIESKIKKIKLTRQFPLHPNTSVATSSNMLRFGFKSKNKVNWFTIYLHYYSLETGEFKTIIIFEFSSDTFQPIDIDGLEYIIDDDVVNDINNEIAYIDMSLNDNIDAKLEANFIFEYTYI